MLRFRAWLVCALLLLAASRLLVPAGPAEVPKASDAPFWAGVLHVHSTHSDGSGTPAEVAAAAAEAGLDFVILTDHGDGTEDASTPAYMSGVLVIAGVEVSTRDGHYLAIGMRPAPYPLAGDAAAVAEDVARLGGVGLIAHPDSSRPALAWHAPDVRGDGLEILNADSAWRDDSVLLLLARLLPYPWRPSAVLATTLTYPEDLLRRLDTPDAGGPRLAVAGVDAHARIGLRPRDDPQHATYTLARWPGYRASFGTFGLVVPWTRGREPTGDAATDASAVVNALRTHRAHVATFALADPAPLRFTALVEGATYLPGARLESHRGVTLIVDAPPLAEASIRLLRNGDVWRETAPGDRLVAPVAGGAPAIYRAEVWLPRRWRQPSLPWLVSQAIALDLPSTTSHQASSISHQALAIGHQALSIKHQALSIKHQALSISHQVERDPCSSIAVEPREAGAVAVTTTLCEGAQASPFAAARVDWPADASSADTVSFTAHADQPMRVSVQVREPTDGDGRRWAHSIYLDETPREVTLPLTSFRAIAPASGSPPAARLHALLFVVDTVNTPRGARRTFHLKDLRIH